MNDEMAREGFRRKHGCCPSGTKRIFHITMVSLVLILGYRWFIAPMPTDVTNAEALVVNQPEMAVDQLEIKENEGEIEEEATQLEPPTVDIDNSEDINDEEEQVNDDGDEEKEDYKVEEMTDSDESSNNEKTSDDEYKDEDDDADGGEGDISDSAKDDTAIADILNESESPNAKFLNGLFDWNKIVQYSRNASQKLGNFFKGSNDEMEDKTVDDINDHNGGNDEERQLRLDNEVDNNDDDINDGNGTGDESDELTDEAKWTGIAENDEETVGDGKEQAGDDEGIIEEAEDTTEEDKKTTEESGETGEEGEATNEYDEDTAEDGEETSEESEVTAEDGEKTSDEAEETSEGKEVIIEEDEEENEVGEDNAEQVKGKAKEGDDTTEDGEEIVEHDVKTMVEGENTADEDTETNEEGEETGEEGEHTNEDEEELTAEEADKSGEVGEEINEDKEDKGEDYYEKGNESKKTAQEGDNNNEDDKETGEVTTEEENKTDVEDEEIDEEGEEATGESYETGKEDANTADKGEKINIEDNEVTEEGHDTSEEVEETTEEGVETDDESEKTIEEGDETAEESVKTSEEGEETGEDGDDTAEEGDDAIEDGEQTSEETTEETNETADEGEEIDEEGEEENGDVKKAVELDEDDEVIGEVGKKTLGDENGDEGDEEAETAGAGDAKGTTDDDEETGEDDEEKAVGDKGGEETVFDDDTYEYTNGEESDDENDKNNDKIDVDSEKKSGFNINKYIDNVKNQNRQKFIPVTGRNLPNEEKQLSDNEFMGNDNSDIAGTVPDPAHFQFHQKARENYFKKMEEHAKLIQKVKEGMKSTKPTNEEFSLSDFMKNVEEKNKNMNTVGSNIVENKFLTNPIRFNQGSVVGNSKSKLLLDDQKVAAVGTIPHYSDYEGREAQGSKATLRSPLAAVPYYEYQRKISAPNNISTSHLPNLEPLRKLLTGQTPQNGVINESPIAGEKLLTSQQAFQQKRQSLLSLGVRPDLADKLLTSVSPQSLLIKFGKNTEGRQDSVIQNQQIDQTRIPNDTEVNTFLDTAAFHVVEIDTHSPDISNVSTYIIPESDKKPSHNSLQSSATDTLNKGLSMLPQIQMGRANSYENTFLKNNSTTELELTSDDEASPIISSSDSLTPSYQDKYVSRGPLPSEKFDDLSFTPPLQEKFASLAEKMSLKSILSDAPLPNIESNFLSESESSGNLNVASTKVMNPANVNSLNSDSIILPKLVETRIPNNMASQQTGQGDAIFPTNQISLETDALPPTRNSYFNTANVFPLKSNNLRASITSSHLNSPDLTNASQDIPTKSKTMNESQGIPTISHIINTTPTVLNSSDTVNKSPHYPNISDIINSSPVVPNRSDIINYFPVVLNSSDKINSYPTVTSSSDNIAASHEAPINSKRNSFTTETFNMDQQSSQNLTKSLPKMQNSACPRKIGLCKDKHPSTALVLFPGAPTTWVRTLLEQLTGEETDSVYKILALLKSHDTSGVFTMNRKVAIETHSPVTKHFDRGIVIISNPYAVERQHRNFRPQEMDWEKYFLWPQTYSAWLESDLPLLVVTLEDLVESPMSHIMQIANFLEPPPDSIDYECAMEVATLQKPDLEYDIREISGIYSSERRRINQNIDTLIKVARTKYPHVINRLESYKTYQNSAGHL